MIAEKFGILANELAVCGCHVHVGLADPAEAPGVSNHLRPWLPTLLALSANSAICNGLDTGYASWRSILWQRWPTAGPPPYLRGPEHAAAMVQGLFLTGAMVDDRMLYWDVRASSHLPTIEIRVCDVPATVDETVLIAILIRAAVMTALDQLCEGHYGPTIPDPVLRAAYWRAARDGIDGYMIDVSQMRNAPAKECIDSMVRAIRPALERTGEYEEASDLIGQVFARGNGAIRQRLAFRRRGRAIDVVTEAARLTLQ